MNRLAVASMLPLWAGTSLLLSRHRRIARPSLQERLRPFIGGDAGRHSPTEGTSASIGSALADSAVAAGARVTGLLGITEDVETRLRRVHAPFDTSAFRIRQLGWAAGALVLATLAARASGAPATPSLVLVAPAPLLAFLLLENQLATASARWQRRIFLELPVVAEQLGMLLSAGYSLGGAIGRIAERGHGACAADLRRVRARLHQGLGEAEALREWAELAQVDALERLVHVLSLEHEASDLGRLITEEARAIRQEAHREVVETIERRAQQVWVPVTVAALVPGVLFISVPFIEALRLFSSA